MMTFSTLNAARETTIDGNAGSLFVRQWIPEAQPVAHLVICHGFNAHSGHYARAAEVFAARRFVVTAMDLRGRGKSDGERFFVETIDDYVSDLAKAVEFACSERPDLPVFVLGHSAGGVTAVAYALENQKRIAGLICESFALQLPAPGIALTLLRGASHIAPHAHVLRLATKDFSRDPAWVAHLDADPLIHNEVQPIQSVAALARAAEKLDQEFADITLPVFILHGTADRAALFEGSQRFFDAAGSSDKSLTLYDGYYHDLLNEVGRDRVFNDIGNWIEKRALSGNPAS
jgi:acylglycerol lipase